MFSSAFKSIASTNINSHYAVAATPTSSAGPWKIYDAKKKSTGKAYSVFVFDRKALDSHAQASALGRSGAGAFRRAVDEVVERLKREAAALARLRHPSVLELVEPVEETRGGGLQFATEAVTGSLASLLQEKDEQERGGGGGGGGGRTSGRGTRYVTEDADGVRRRREIEIDELEIQKGLLQLGKALEFLHENAGLVHGNLTPDAVLVNAKSDWKISGLAFCGPAAEAETTSAAASSFPPVSVHEILTMDARLPRAVQLSLDYAAPDLVFDSRRTPAADMYALGLLCVALYNAPHRSPIEAHASVSAYRRVFAAGSGSGSGSGGGGGPSPANGFGCARPLPRELAAHVLPRLLTRRPAQRMTAREFQTSEYFDNILVATIRFLDAFPAKTHAEKAAFLRGLHKVLPSFPKSVMEKKVLPALLEELKDRELAPPLLQNVFRIVELLPSAKRVFSERVLPALKTLFLVPAGPAGGAGSAAAAAAERDAPRDASLMVVLDRLAVVTSNTTGKEFKDDVLPIVAAALESPTPSVVDAALRSVPAMLPMLDFSTIKHELFPVVATIFSKTSSLAIKIRGLQAFVVLCGGGDGEGDDEAAHDHDDGLDGLSRGVVPPPSTSTALDKYTMQDKIVPLIRAIKTKEPAVMMAALRVLRVVGRAADADFVALELLPVLWTMALGPLLNLAQFQAFVRLIKSLSARVEEEQVRKLQDLATGGGGGGAGEAASSNLLLDEFSALGSGRGGGRFSAWDVGGAPNGHGAGGGGGGGGGSAEDDFERLVKGKGGASPGGGGGGLGVMDAGWGAASSSAAGGGTPRLSPRPSPTAAATFSWSTPPQSTTPAAGVGAAARTVTPDLGGFAAMTPSSTQFSQALPARPLHGGGGGGSMGVGAGAGVGSAAWPATTSSSGWGTAAAAAPSLGQLGQQQQQRTTASAFSLPPPPPSGGATTSSGSSFRLPPPPSGSSSGGSGGGGLALLASMAPTATATTPSYTPNYSRAALGGGGMAAPNTNMPMGMNMSMGMSMGMGTNMGMGMGTGMNSNAGPGSSGNSAVGGMLATQPGKTGLDKYESLL